MANALTLQSLPLFPLGTVLFPGGVLPLRIFEVRYLDMIGRCHRAGAPFGVVSLTQGHEVRQPGSGPEAFAAVGTLATIDTLEHPRPGLMVIRALGGQRFRVRSSEQLKHGLWVADVQQVQDDLAVAVPEDLQPAAEALGRLIVSLQDKGAAEPIPIAQPWRLDDCGWVANRWCELLPLPVALKQRLMELDNPLLRLELVSDVLAKTGITS
ncbi:LON peptidase substrate-binding domain-containing protein [Ramlibacter tataouinensis]|nr:LON peptidase substrate-binding domain-containing protein [Ramlibacter tataouinensis]WBY00908.1 LON peptidase substrate-binding domain-containing protein [Ramlibacter tataouinensis]